MKIEIETNFFPLVFEKDVPEGVHIEHLPVYHRRDSTIANEIYNFTLEFTRDVSLVLIAKWIHNKIKKKSKAYVRINGKKKIKKLNDITITIKDELKIKIKTKN